MRTFNFLKKTFLRIIPGCSILVNDCDNQQIEDKQINIVFRFDDYSSLSSTDLELKIIEVFRKNEASITFSVVPFCCTGNVEDPAPKDTIPITPAKGDILKKGLEEGVVDIALHGYSHQTINSKQMTEFSGLDYDCQVEKIAKGKKFLENIIDASITSFVPPWDQYDLNTVRALEDLGFSTLSASKGRAASKDTKLRFLPASCSLSQLRNAVKVAKTSSDNQPLIVVLIHHYDFREIDENSGIVTMKEFCDLMSWLKSKRNVRLISIGQAANEIKDLSSKRFLPMKRNYLLNELLPPSLRNEGSLFLYQESPVYIKTLLKVGGFYLLIVIFGIILSSSIGCLLFPGPTNIMTIGILGSIVLLAIILINAFRDLRIYVKGLGIIASAIGISIGFYICFNS